MRGRVVAVVVPLVVATLGWTGTASAQASASSAIPPVDADATVALVRGADGELRVVDLAAGDDDVLTAAGLDGDVEVLALDGDGPIEGAQVAVPAPDPVRSVQYHLDAIDAEALWPVGTGSGAVIAVVDSGVRETHVDFSGRLLPGACFLGAGGNPCAEPGQGPAPFHPHGTHVAGIAAAGAGDGLGVVGVAPAAQVLPIRVLDQNNGGFLSDLAAGIVYAIQTDLDGDGVVPDVDVINLSIQSQTSNAVVSGAIDQAIAAGVPVIASAGNLAGIGNPTVFPAAVPGVIGVGSVGPDIGGFTRAPTSSFGSWVDLAAPGVDIWSDGIDNDSDVSLRSGTSMSAPQVSGAAAALLAARPELTVAEVADLLTSTAADLGPVGRDDEYGAGLLDLAAVAAASGVVPTPVAVTATPEAGLVSLSWTGGPVGTTDWLIEVDGVVEAVLPADARTADLATGDATGRVYGVHPVLHYVRVEGAVTDPVAPLLPPGPPLDLVVEPGPNRLELAWSEPAELGGGTTLEYDVRVLLEGTVVHTETTTTTAVVVRELPPRGLYDVEVAARTEVGAGPAATASAETLGLVAPSEPVVRTVIVAGEALMLDWDPVIGPAEFYDIISPAGLIERLPGDATMWEGPPSEDRLARLIAVVAVNDLGSVRSEWQEMPDLPGEVVDLAAVADDGRIVASWSPPVGEPVATGYVVEWGPPGATVNRAWVTEPGIEIEPDDVGAPVEIRVRAQTALAVGWPVSVGVPPLFEAPTAATALQAIVGGADDGVVLTWEPGAGDVDLVILERRIAEGDWRPIVLLSDEDRTATDRRAAVGLLNSYRIRSVGPAGEAVSAPVTVLIPVPITEPLDLSVFADRAASLEITWNAPLSGPPDGYEVVVRDGSDIVLSAVRTDLRVQLDAVPTGVTLSVEVRALDDGRTGPAASLAVEVPPPGYWLVTAGGDLLSFGGAAGVLDARSLDTAAPGSGEVRVVDATTTSTGRGVAALLADGTVVSTGDAIAVASIDDALEAGEFAAAVELTSTGLGAWVVTDRGRVLTRGDARWFGDLSTIELNGLIVGIAATPSDGGYRLAAADGGVFAFGDATFHGSMGGQALNAAVVGIAGTRTGAGYLLGAADGGVFAFGDAVFHGSMGGRPLNQPIVGLVSAGEGYLLAAADGGVFAFGPDAVFAGSRGGQPLDSPVIGIVGRDPIVGSGGSEPGGDGLPDVRVESHPQVTARDLDVLHVG
ncbi:MAG: S8 family serine peptidase [Actinomycetota bacterium]